MHNENLKFINIDGWDIPRPYRDQEVRLILQRIVAMEPGEVVGVEGIAPERIWLVRSSLYRQIQRHELNVVVSVRDKQLRLMKRETS